MSSRPDPDFRVLGAQPGEGQGGHLGSLWVQNKAWSGVQGAAKPPTENDF